jgi:hypothetical protein
MSHGLFLLICLLLIVPTLWAILDIAHRDFSSLRKKALWGAFVVLVPPLGGIVYLIRHQIRRITQK